MTSTTKAWLHGLFAGAISTFATAGGAALTMPDTFNFSKTGLINLLKIVLVPTAVSVFAYLKQSPLPTSTQTVTVTQEVTKE